MVSEFNGVFCLCWLDESQWGIEKNQCKYHPSCTSLRGSVYFATSSKILSFKLYSALSIYNAEFVPLPEWWT